MLFYNPVRCARCQRSSATSSDPSAWAGVRSARSNASCRLLAEASSRPGVLVMESDEPGVPNASRPNGSPRRVPIQDPDPEESPSHIGAVKDGDDAVRPA